MKSYNDTCGAGANYLNTGFKSQCLESVTVLLVLSKTDFKFATVADFKTKEKWVEAIKNKDLVPLFELYELTSANTEETFYESRNFKKRTGKAMKITTAELYLSICADAALRSYANSEYNRVFEVTEDGDVIGVFAEDGIGVQGQLLKDFTVGVRQPATTAKPPTTLVTITYNDAEELSKNGVITTPDFDPVLELNGIFTVNIEQVGAGTATGFEFKATIGCSKTNFPSLDVANLKFVKPDNTEQTATFTYDTATETYEATGTALVSGTLSTDGVQEDTATGDLYEGSANITIP